MGLEKALESEHDCSQVLQTIAVGRGAINGLLAEVLEGHICLHMLDHKRKPTAEQFDAAEELIEW
jgi:DNA-binding FrmR family transcriptional regulator